jgi:hypothetical protein
MRQLIEQMRGDFDRLSVVEGWSASDIDEYGRAIRAAVDARDEAVVAWWADWLRKGLSAARQTQPVASVGQCCPDCGHWRRPRGTDGYCTGPRPDLPQGGGPETVRYLPADNGAECSAFARR